jgi:hypothetical protein
LLEITSFEEAFEWIRAVLVSSVYALVPPFVVVWMYIASVDTRGSNKYRRISFNTIPDFIHIFEQNCF